MYSSSSNIYFSIDHIVNPLNLSWGIVDLKYNFINFNFEKLLYAEVTVTGIVSKILQAMHVFETHYFFLICSTLESYFLF